MRNLQNDVALLQLERPIQASSKVNTVCLPSSGSRVSAGTQCYITGMWNVPPQFADKPPFLLLKKNGSSEENFRCVLFPNTVLPKQVECIFGDARNSYCWRQTRTFWVKWIEAVKWKVKRTRAHFFVRSVVQFPAWVFPTRFFWWSVVDLSLWLLLSSNMIQIKVFVIKFLFLTIDVKW